MNSRRLHIGISLEAAQAATAKWEKLDRDDALAIAGAHSARVRRRELLDQRADAIKRATTKYALLDDGEHPDIRYGSGSSVSTRPVHAEKAIRSSRR
jgi:hypothetical protein